MSPPPTPVVKPSGPARNLRSRTISPPPVVGGSTLLIYPPPRHILHRSLGMVLSLPITGSGLQLVLRRHQYLRQWLDATPLL